MFEASIASNFTHSIALSLSSHSLVLYPPPHHLPGVFSFTNYHQSCFSSRFLSLSLLVDLSEIGANLFLIISCSTWSVCLLAVVVDSLIFPLSSCLSSTLLAHTHSIDTNTTRPSCSKTRQNSFSQIHFSLSLSLCAFF